MPETWPPVVTDNPGFVTLTPINLRGALAFLRWDASHLSERLKGKVARSDIQNFLDYGLGLGVDETGLIIRLLCQRLWFGLEGGPQGVFLKSETFGNAPGGGGYIQFTNNPKKLRPAP